MGMSDSQFKSYIRLLPAALRDMVSEADPDKQKWMKS